MWYVSYRLDGSTRMRVFKTRPLAIRAACDILRDAARVDVQVGPMLDDEPALTGSELRRLCAIVRGQRPGEG